MIIRKISTQKVSPLFPVCPSLFLIVSFIFSTKSLNNMSPFLFYDHIEIAVAFLVVNIFSALIIAS